ncbi:hypothetical protein [Peribacillus huizhouensis]|uniref:Uncharacterized protein n=1 Tax=Peribacillus huizhouensis TaxID=1501239 RepID=A0ABR6CSG2_9BACI|nr:hypothetical protein [Peribacillus huizhouensis]MBA9027598.1 hypothetical protein [Peribacillus huizhouensis]
MNKTEFTQEEIVAIEGDDIIKEHMAKNNKLMINIFNRFVTDLDQRYESVETIGKGGKKTKYILGAKRDVEADRKDKRVNNGKGQVPLKYEQAFPIMMLEYLETHQSEKPQTIPKWLLDMGFITKEMFEARKLKYDSRVLEAETNRLVENEVVKKGYDDVVEDYVVREIQRLNDYFMAVVARLNKAKIITHVPYEMGKCKIPVISESWDDESGETEQSISYRYEYPELSSYVVGEISLMQRELQNQDKYKHLSLKEIHNLKNMKIVQEYWKEYKYRLNRITDESGERLYLVLAYTAHAIFLRAGKNPIIKWLEKNNREAIEFYNSNEIQYFLENRNDFHKTRNDYVVGLAKKRQERFNTPIKVVKESIEDYGGKRKVISVENDPYDDKNKWDKNKEFMYLELYAKAYEKLQEYYGHTFK